MSQGQVKEKMNGFIAERNFDAMLEYANQLIQESSSNYIGYWWKARALTFKRDTDGALHWFMEAMKRANSDEEESKIASSMANVYNVLKLWDESLNYSAIALALNSKNVVGIIARSIALSATGKRDEANRLLDSNQKLYKDDYQRACVAAVKRNKIEMLEYLRKAMEMNPSSKITVQFDPDFAAYRGDSTFKEITS